MATRKEAVRNVEEIMKQVIAKIQQGVCRFVGEILVEAGHVTTEQVQAAICEQSLTGERLGEILIRQNALSRHELVDALALQLNYRFSEGPHIWRQLGEIMIASRHLSRWQLSQALNQQEHNSKRLGEILIEMGFSTRGQIEQAISDQAIGTPKIQYSSTRHSLGELLSHHKQLTPEILAHALKRQKEEHKLLGDVLIEEGHIDESELEDLLAIQLLLNLQDDTEHTLNATEHPLGEILIETQQLSRLQLKKAMKTQKYNLKRLGEILIEKGLLPLKELQRALRVQKRMAKLLMVSTLGSVVLSACSTPTVPVQHALATYEQLSIANTRRPPVTSPNISGPFRVLQIGENQRVKVYQNGTKLIENVPFFRQGNDNTCGQAILATMTNFWGIQKMYQEIVNEANPNNLPTTAGQISQYMRSQGINAQEYRGATLENLIAQVNKGRPTPVLLDFGGLSQEHYVIVTGYNLKRQSLIVHDSLEGPYIEMDMRYFARMWQNKSLRLVHIFGGNNYKQIMFDIYK